MSFASRIMSPEILRPIAIGSYTSMWSTSHAQFSVTPINAASVPSSVALLLPLYGTNRAAPFVDGSSANLLAH
jgi:hypothetical protein